MKLTLLTRIFALSLILLGSAGLAIAQTKVPQNAKVFIAPMEGNLHTFIAAELVKQKVPLTVVMEESAAEFILTGGSRQTGDNKWYDTVFGTERDRNEGSVTMVSVKDKSLAWAGEAGDRSLWFGALKRGGQRKVADRIVNRMKKDLFK